MTGRARCYTPLRCLWLRRYSVSPRSTLPCALAPWPYSCFHRSTARWWCTAGRACFKTPSLSPGADGDVPAFGAADGAPGAGSCCGPAVPVPASCGAPALKDEANGGSGGCGAGGASEPIAPHAALRHGSTIANLDVVLPCPHQGGTAIVRTRTHTKRVTLDNRPRGISYVAFHPFARVCYTSIKSGMRLVLRCSITVLATSQPRLRPPPQTSVRIVRAVPRDCAPQGCATVSSPPTHVRLFHAAPTCAPACSW